MSKPLEGMTVVEVAMWGFVPSGGAVLAEWGADVIKVEHALTGDPQRGLTRMGDIDHGRPEPGVGPPQPRQEVDRHGHRPARGARTARRPRP